jgi:uncharacterized protein YjdB
MIAGFEVYQYVGTPTYNSSKVKKAVGAIAQAGDMPASVFFYKENIAKKTGLTKQYFAKSDQDPENQTNRVNYRHYFIAVPAKLEGIGAIIGNVGEKVDSVTINTSDPSTIDPTETLQLEWGINPPNAENQAVTFASSDEGKATVSANGLVTGVATGSATITITTVDQSKTDTIVINVN